MSAYYCYGCEQLRDDDVHGFNTEPRYPADEGRCDACKERDDERAYERSLEDHYGGSTPSLRELQAEARRLK